MYLRCATHDNHEPHYGLLPDMNTVENQEVKDFMQERQSCSEMLKFQLEKAQLRQKMYADRNRSERTFQVGEKVYLKLQPYGQSSVANRPCPKLAYKFYGPFEVEARIGEVAYRLKLPEHSQIHPVFHVSQLKPFTPDYSPVSSDLPVQLEVDASEVFPEEILDRRLSKKGNKAQLQVLIKWTSLPASEATWEDYEVVKHRFPDAPAWGQAGS